MSLYPGLSAEISQAFEAVRTGATVNPNKISVRQVVFFDRRVIKTGTTAMATTLQFFQTQYAKWRSNWPAPSGLQNDTAFWLQGVRFDLEYGQTIGGAISANGAANLATSASFVATLHESLKNMLQSGLATLRIGDRPIFEVYGLQHFPAGSRPDIGAAAAGTYTAGQGSVLSTFSNGTTLDANMFRCVPTAVLPSKPVTFNLEYETAPVLAATDIGEIIARCELVGTLVSASNG